MKLYGFFSGNKTIVKDNDSKSWLISKFYGEKKGPIYFLDIYETLYFLDWGSLTLEKKESFEKLIKSLKKEALEKYAVFKHFRDLGYVIKTGLKFGFDFRVYPKGKNPEKSHSKYVVWVVKEKAKINTNELARAIRMALGLNTDLLLAVVGDDLEVITYNFSRIELQK
jgi:tRNA-intron endonuclease